MAYIVKVDSKEFKVDIAKEGKDFIVSLDGEKKNVEVVHQEGIRLTIVVDNRPFAIVMESDSQIMVNGEAYVIDVMDERIQKITKASPEKFIKKELEIKAVMPGLVIDVNVKEGDAIKTGDGLLVVEAMKMQNEMKSPRDGMVKQILVKTGQTVNSGDTLVIIE